MSIEVRPMGVTCNLACTYCYQEPVREAGNITAKYDLNKIIAELEKTKREFHLFGGEALLLPKKDMETLFKFGYEKYGKNGIQTNGTLIDDDHIELFKKYKVGVGVSIDGPGELNDLREVRAGKRGTDEKVQRTREATNAIFENIQKMRRNGISVGIIITLHKVNGTPERLQRIISMIEWLADLGVRGGNIHVLEVDETMPDQEKHVLSQEENIEAFLTLAKFFSKRPDLKYAPFSDIPELLQGQDKKVTCYWKNCDPMNTQAVYGIEGDGALSNCGRTNKEGIDWFKADRNSYSRYISFYYTPDELGGCQGCRFWSLCGGSCPGEADKGDFRNKTIHCETQRAVLGYYEEELESQGITPITKSPLLPMIETTLLDQMKQGKNIRIHQILEEISKPTVVEVL